MQHFDNSDSRTLSKEGCLVEVNGNQEQTIEEVVPVEEFKKCSDETSRDHQSSPQKNLNLTVKETDSQFKSEIKKGSSKIDKLDNESEEEVTSKEIDSKLINDSSTPKQNEQTTINGSQDKIPNENEAMTASAAKVETIEIINNNMNEEEEKVDSESDQFAPVETAAAAAVAEQINEEEMQKKENSVKLELTHAVQVQQQRDTSYRTPKSKGGESAEFDQNRTVASEPEDRNIQALESEEQTIQNHENTTSDKTETQNQIINNNKNKNNDAYLNKEKEEIATPEKEQTDVILQPVAHRRGDQMWKGDSESQKAQNNTKKANNNESDKAISNKDESDSFQNPQETNRIRDRENISYTKNSSDFKRLIQYEMSDSMRNETHIAPFSVSHRGEDTQIRYKGEESSILSPQNQTKGQVKMESQILDTQDALEEPKQSTKQQPQKKQNQQSVQNDDVVQVDSKGYFDDSLIENNSPEESSASLATSVSLIIGCVIYGYLLPRRYELFGAGDSYTWLIVSAYLIFEAIGRVCIFGVQILDPEIAFQIVLTVANSLLPSDWVLMEYLFFARFLVALWNCRSFSKRIRTITEVISAAMRPSIEVIGFIVVIVLLFTLAASSFVSVRTLNELPAMFSFNSIAYFSVFVAKEYTSDSVRSFLEDELKSERANLFYFSLLLAFCILFFVKVIGESLLAVVQKVSQEQCSEYTGAHYSCGFLAIFRNDETMLGIYRRRRIYQITQGIFIFAVCYTQTIAINATESQTASERILAQVSRFSGIFFVVYEITIDVALQSGMNIIKNFIYVFVIAYPSAFPLLAAAAFLGFLGEIVFFSAITNMIATLIVDFLLVLALNELIRASSPSLPTWVPRVLEFFVTLPYLKGMMLRFSEVFEIETEEDNRSLATIHSQVNEEVQLKLDFDDEESAYQLEASHDGTRVISKQSADITLNKPRRQRRKISSKSLWIFTDQSPIRRISSKIVCSRIFIHISSVMFFVSALKELINFASGSLLEDQLLIGLRNTWDDLIEPIFLITYLSLHSISSGLLLHQHSFLRKSLANWLLIAITLAYFIQPLVSEWYLGFVRILYFLLLPPFGMRKLNDILNVMSKGKQVIISVIVIALGIVAILLCMVDENKKESTWMRFACESIYYFAMNLIVSAILVEFSKQSIFKQNQNSVWNMVQRKIEKHQLNFHILKQRDTTTTAADDFFVKFIKNPSSNLGITILIGVYYLGLFVSYQVEGLAEQEKDESAIIACLFRKVITATMSFLVIFYAFMHTRIFGIVTFVCSSALNSILILQAISLVSVIALDIFIQPISDLSILLQFLLQLPILLRTKYMFPLIKFRKSIVRQLLITIVSSCVFAVVIAHIMSNIEIGLFEYMLFSFNESPHSITLNSENILKSIAMLALLLVINGLANSVLLLDVIRKFDMSESAQAKQKYKQLLVIFEDLWEQFKCQSNPSFIQTKNILKFFVKFDYEANKEEEEGDSKGQQKNLRKIDYMIRIQRIGFNVDFQNRLYYKDLLFALIGERFNTENRELPKFSQGQSYSLSAISSTFLSNLTVEDLEKELSGTNQKVQKFKPITQQLYAQLVFSSWRRFAVPKKQSSAFVVDDEEDDSIFFDPNIVPLETIKQQTLTNLKIH